MGEAGQQNWKDIYVDYAEKGVNIADWEPYEMKEYMWIQ